MTINELGLENYFDVNESGVEIFVLKKESEQFVVEKLATTADDQDTIFNRLKDNFSNQILEKTSVVNLSSYDDLITNIYKYDLEVNENTKLGKIINFPEEEKVFHDDLSKIYGIIYKIGAAHDFIILYSQNYAFTNTFSNKYLFGVINTAIPNQKEFKLTEDVTFKLNMNADIVYKNNEFYILNLKVAEKNFGITEVIATHAAESIEKIGDLGIISNLEALNERVSEIAFSRKLMKLKTDSPVFRLPSERIIEFSRNNRIFREKFKYDNESNQIILDTQASQNLFIRLLNDDAVHSELTGEDYFANSKDKA